MSFGHSAFGRMALGRATRSSVPTVITGPIRGIARAFAAIRGNKDTI